MKWLALVFFAIACQSVQEKNALILKDRVDKLHSPYWRPMRCRYQAQLAASQLAKYKVAFADEQLLLDQFDVTYEWLPHSSKCSVHVTPLTPLTANQKAFVDQAMCTLVQVFFVRSPFDGLRVLPTDVIDKDDQILLAQRSDSDLGIYLSKKNFDLETRTARNGTLRAKYSQFGEKYLPQELSHQTASFNLVLKDFEWEQAGGRTVPKALTIAVGESVAEPTPHTILHLKECL